MKPETPLRLRGDFENLLDALPSIDQAVVNALQSRPDLQGARAIETTRSCRSGTDASRRKN